MPESRGPVRVPVTFDDARWAQDLARASTEAAEVARVARRRMERDGANLIELRPCDPEGRDGTRLGGCVKLYLPPPAGPWGLVLAPTRDPATGRVLLDVVAFGPRHPPEGRRVSVYQLAHQRLHGRNRVS